MRLFFAMPLPDPIRRELAGLRCDLGKARWVPERQLHVTLRFLGEVDELHARALIEEVRARRSVEPWPRLELCVRGVGIFGSPRRPRVLWAGLAPLAPLAAIAAALEASAVAANLPPERRPFAGHVTLARFARADVAKLRSFLTDHARFTSSAFDVPEVVLYRSTLGPSGAVHDPLERFALGSAR
jgi:2'-5' RNA ligase